MQYDTTTAERDELAALRRRINEYRHASYEIDVSHSGWEVRRDGTVIGGRAFQRSNDDRPGILVATDAVRAQEEAAACVAAHMAAALPIQSQNGAIKTTFLLSMVTSIAWEKWAANDFWQATAGLVERVTGKDFGCHPGLTSWKETMLHEIKDAVRPALLSDFPWMERVPSKVDDAWMAAMVREHGEYQEFMPSPAPGVRV